MPVQQLNKLLIQLVQTMEVCGVDKSLYSICPHCEQRVHFSMFSDYGKQEVSTCGNCGGKYVIKYKKGRDWHTAYLNNGGDNNC